MKGATGFTPIISTSLSKIKKGYQELVDFVNGKVPTLTDQSVLAGIGSDVTFAGDGTYGTTTQHIHTRKAIKYSYDTSSTFTLDTAHGTVQEIAGSSSTWEWTQQSPSHVYLIEYFFPFKHTTGTASSLKLDFVLGSPAYGTILLSPNNRDITAFTANYNYLMEGFAVYVSNDNYPFYTQTLGLQLEYGGSSWTGVVAAAVANPIFLAVYDLGNDGSWSADTIF